jgi:hypothetical protein
LVADLEVDEVRCLDDDAEVGTETQPVPDMSEWFASQETPPVAQTSDSRPSL